MGEIERIVKKLKRAARGGPSRRKSDMTYADKPKNMSYHKYKKRLAISYKGGRCVDCARAFPDNPEVFTFDHLPGTIKTKSLARMMGMPWAKIEEELDKCELVCHNCHAIRTANRGPTGYNTLKSRAQIVSDSE